MCQFLSKCTGVKSDYFFLYFERNVGKEESFQIPYEKLSAQNEPHHEKRVLITQANREGSGEPTHPCNPTRAYDVHLHNI